MNLGEVWRTLGIARTQDSAAIRRAYAARLKELDLDRDAQAYAALRDARAIALRWAAGRSAPAVEESADGDRADEAPRPAVAWPYAAPELFGHAPDPALTATASDDPARPYIVPGPIPALRGEIREVPLPAGDPFAVPALAELPADAPLVQPDKGRDVAFYNLLFPDGEQSDEALGAADLTRAQGHFQALLRQAQGGALSMSEATDNWLADTLARAWPRSAPFVAEAAEAFGWERQAGLLGERGAVAFLNARLKGMRFHEKVLQPDHTLHKAWMELSQPGRASWVHRTLTGRAEVEQLITGVRQRFPELESYWDSWRVASWEGAPKSASGGGGPGWWVWALIIFGGLRILATLGQSSGPDAQAVPPAYLTDVSPPGDLVVLDRAAKTVFGESVGFAQLEELNSELAGVFRANMPKDFAQTEERYAYERKMLNLVRERVYHAGQAAGGRDLKEVMELRLDHLLAAQKVGPIACIELYRLAELPASASLGPSTIVAEQRSAARFLRTGKLVPPPRSGQRSASIPGSIVDQVIKETALPVAVVEKALQAGGKDADRCAVSIALLRATLKDRSSSRDAILRIL